MVPRNALCAWHNGLCFSSIARDWGIDSGREQDIKPFCFSFPYFFKCILHKHMFSFFIRNVAFFKTENGILEANYRRKLLQQRLHMRPLRMMTMFPDGLTATTTRNWPMYSRTLPSSFPDKTDANRVLWGHSFAWKYVTFYWLTPFVDSFVNSVG